MKIVVIGAGVVGASCAHALAKAGAEIVIIDPNRPGRATAAGAGIISPWSSAPGDPSLDAISLAGARHYPDLIASLAEDGETDTSYRRVGAIVVSADPAQLDEVERRTRARAAQDPSAGDVARITAHEAQNLFPPLADGLAAVHVQGGARVDGRKLAASLLRASVRHGAILREASAEPILHDSRVTGVAIGNEVIDADHVVVTAGAWASDLLARLGITLDVAPQRGQIVHLRKTGANTAHWPVVLPISSHYLVAFDDSRVVVGATRETGSGFDYRVTAGGLAQVLNEALRVAPGLADFEHIETRIGFRPMGPGGMPVLGRVPGLDGLVIGNGFGPGGLTRGPYAGHLLAQLVLGHAPAFDLSPFDLSPFGAMSVSQRP